MSMSFREVDPYLNPKNKDLPRPEVLGKAAKEAQEARLKRVYAHCYEKKGNRHSDWSPYYQSSYAGHDTSDRKNLVGGTHLVPMALRYIPPCERYDALDGGKAREAADRKAKDDKQGIPDWSPYFRGRDEEAARCGRPPRPAAPAPASRRASARADSRPASAAATTRSAAATTRSFASTTTTFADGEPLRSQRHMFETTNRQRAREEAFFRERRASRPQSASSSRRRAW